ESGNRLVHFSRELWIEQDDFMEVPPKGYFRLFPGGMVRLKGAYIIKCDEVVKDETGAVKELRCSYVENSRSGSDTSELKVRGTIHWVSAPHALDIEVRQYDRLFNDPDPNGHKDRDFREFINPDALRVIPLAYAEASLRDLKPLDKVQFIRKGYYCVDSDSNASKMVFNLTVGLKDAWAKAHQS
ncbi:MAG: glutamine--tRNA ligase, partial [Bacteroidetes bacterium]